MRQSIHTPARQETSMADTRKGMRVSILTDRFANKVPFDTLILVGNGIPEIFEASDATPAVEIHAHRAGLQFPHVAILADGVDSPAAFISHQNDMDHAGPNWPMMSGAFIYTCDSRFPFSHPVPLHNRYEMKA